MTFKKVSLLFLISFCQLTLAQSFFVKYQAEDAELEMKMDIMSDSAAEGGDYITTPDIGSNWGFSKATFHVQVPRTGKYAIYTRTKATSSSSDSFYISVNGSPLATWGHGGPATWSWKRVHLNYSGTPAQFNLQAGHNEVVVRVREDGASLDAIALVLESVNVAPFLPAQTSAVDFNANPTSLTWTQTSPEVPLMIRIDEADAVILHHPMALGQDLTAENTGFAYTPEGSGNGLGGYIEYSFEVPNPDQYGVYARVKAPDSGSDTVTFRMNTATDRTWTIPMTGNQWQWLPITSTPGSNTPDLFNLSHGIHNLRLIQLEDGVQIDGLIVTPSPATLDLATLNADSQQQITNRLVQGPIYEFQAEDAELDGFLVSDQTGADYGKAVWKPEATGNMGSAKVTFNIDLPKGDVFALFARVKGPIGSSDSFRMDVNGQNLTDFHIAWASTDFAWRRVNNWPSTTTPQTWNLPAGKHTITFWNREDGAYLDSIALVSTSSNVKEEDLEARPDIVYLEAESATSLTQPMEIHSDMGNTRFGSYVSTKNGAGTNGSATYTFKVRKSGTYRIYGRTLATNSGDDSFNFQLNNQSSFVWSPPIRQDWFWYRVLNWNASTNSKTPMQFQLNAGEHTLTISQREDGTALDALMISNDLAFYFPENEPMPPTFGIDDPMYVGGMFLGKDSEQQFIPFATIPQSRNGKDTVQTDWYGVAVPNQDYVAVALGEVDKPEHQLQSENLAVWYRWNITTEMPETQLQDVLKWSWRDSKTGQYWTGTEWVDQPFYTKVHNGDIPVLPGSNGSSLSSISNDQVTAAFVDYVVADGFWTSGRMSIDVEFRAEIGTALKRIYNGSHRLTYTTWQDGLEIRNARPLVDVDIYDNETAYWQAPLVRFNGQNFDPQYLQWQWHRPAANLYFDGNAWVSAASATWRFIQGGTGFWSQFAITDQNIEGNINPSLWDGYWFNNNSDEPIEIRFAYNPPPGTPDMHLFNASFETTFRLGRPPIATAVSGFGVTNEPQPIITVQQPNRSIIFMGYQRPDGTWLDVDWRQNNPGLNFTRPPVDLEPGVNYRVHVASWNGRFGAQNLVGSVRFEPPALSVGEANIQEPNLARNAAGSALLNNLKPTVTFVGDSNATHYYVGFRDQNGKWHESDWRQHQVTTTSYSPRTGLKPNKSYQAFVIAANNYSESAPLLVDTIRTESTKMTSTEEQAVPGIAYALNNETFELQPGLDGDTSTPDGWNTIRFDKPTALTNLGNLHLTLKSNTTGLYWDGQSWNDEPRWIIAIAPYSQTFFFYHLPSYTPGGPVPLPPPGIGMMTKTEITTGGLKDQVVFQFQNIANYNYRLIHYPLFLEDSLESLSFSFGYYEDPHDQNTFIEINTRHSLDLSPLHDPSPLNTVFDQQIISITDDEPQFEVSTVISHPETSLNTEQFRYFIYDKDSGLYWTGDRWNIYTSTTYLNNAEVTDLNNSVAVNFPAPYVNEDGTIDQGLYDRFFRNKQKLTLMLIAEHNYENNNLKNNPVFIIQRSEAPYSAKLTVNDFILPPPAADQEPVRLQPVEGSSMTDPFDVNDFSQELEGQVGSLGEIGAAVAFRIHQTSNGNSITEVSTLSETVPLQAFFNGSFDFTPLYDAFKQLSLENGQIYYLSSFLTLDHNQTSNSSNWQPIDYPTYVQLESQFAGQTKRLLRRMNPVTDVNYILANSHRFEAKEYDSLAVSVSDINLTYGNNGIRALGSSIFLEELYAANTDETLLLNIPGTLQDHLTSVSLELYELFEVLDGEDTTFVEGERVKASLVTRQGNSPITEASLPLDIVSKEGQYYRLKIYLQDLYGFRSINDFNFGSIRGFENTSLSFAFSTDQNDPTYYASDPTNLEVQYSCKTNNLRMTDFNLSRFDGSNQTIKGIRVNIQTIFTEADDHNSMLCTLENPCSGFPTNNIDLLVDALGNIPPTNPNKYGGHLAFSINSDGVIIGDYGYISVGQLSGSMTPGNRYYQIAPYPFRVYAKQITDTFTNRRYNTDEPETNKVVVNFKTGNGITNLLANRYIIREKIVNPFSESDFDHILNYINDIGCSPFVYPEPDHQSIVFYSNSDADGWTGYNWKYSTINNTYYDLHSPDTLYMSVGFDRTLHDPDDNWTARLSLLYYDPNISSPENCSEDTPQFCYPASVVEMDLTTLLRGRPLVSGELYDVNPKDIWNTLTGGQLDQFIRTQLGLTTSSDIPNGKFGFAIRIYRQDGDVNIDLANQSGDYPINFERVTTDRTLVNVLRWQTNSIANPGPTLQIDFESSLRFQQEFPFEALASTAPFNHSLNVLPGNLYVRWVDHQTGQYWTGTSWENVPNTSDQDINNPSWSNIGNNATHPFFESHSISERIDSANNTLERTLNLQMDHQFFNEAFFDGQTTRGLRLELRYRRPNDDAFRITPDLNFPFMTLLDVTEDDQGCTDCVVDPEDADIESPKHFQTNAAKNQLKRIMPGAADALPASIRNYLEMPEPILLESALTTAGDLYWVVGNSVSNEPGETGVSEMENFHWQHTGNPSDTGQAYNQNHPEVWAWFRAPFDPEFDDTRIYAYIFPYRDDVEDQSSFLDFETRETVALRKDSPDLWRSETNLAYRYVTNDPDSEKNYYLVAIPVPESKLQKPQLASFNASLGTTRNTVSGASNNELGDILLSNIPIDSQNRLLSISYLDESSQQQLISVGFWDRLGYQLTSRAMPTHVPVGSDIEDLVLMGGPGEIDIFGRTIQSSMGYYRDFNNSMASEQSFALHFSTMTNSRSQLMQSATDYWSGNATLNPANADGILEQTNTLQDTNPITQTLFENDSAKGRVLAQTGFGADFQDPQTLNYQRIYYFSMAPPTFFEGNATTPSTNYPIYNLMTRTLSETTKRAWMEGILTVSPSGSVQVVVAGENKEEPILAISNPSIALMERWGFNVVDLDANNVVTPGSNAFVQGHADSQAINNADIYLPKTYHDMHDTSGNPTQGYINDVNLIAYRQINEFGKTITMYPPRGLDIDLTNTTGEGWSDDDWGITVLDNANDLGTHYEYDSYHNVSKIIEADAGISRFIYNYHGWLRFSQSQTMAISNSWLETIYDINGRIFKTRVIYPSSVWSDATLEEYANDPIAPDTALTTPTTDDKVILDPSFQVSNTYDVYPQHQEYPWPAYTNLTKVAWPTIDYLIQNYPFKDSADFTLGNPMGQVTQTVGPESAERFYYDHRGNLIIHLIIHARLPQIHTLFYNYNFFDQVERFSYPQGGQHYGVQYDGWQRVVGIFDLDPASVRFMAHVGHQGSFINPQQQLQFHYPADVPFFAGPLLDTSSQDTFVAPNNSRRMVTYNYNASGQMTSMVYGDTQPQATHYKYDKAIKESYYYDVRSLMLNKKVYIADHNQSSAGTFQDFLEVDLDYFDNNPNLKTSTVLGSEVAKRYTGDIGAILEKHYMFDPNGNVPSTHTENQMGFQYDLRGQLIDADYTQGADTFSYSYAYDKHGNRKHEWRTEVPVDYSIPGDSNNVETLQYDHTVETTTNRLTEINIAGTNPTGFYHQANYYYLPDAGELSGTVDQIVRYKGAAADMPNTSYDQIEFAYQNLPLSTQPTHIKEQKRISEGDNSSQNPPPDRYEPGSDILDFYYNYSAAGARLREIKETRDTNETLVDTEITHWLPMGNENLAEFDETGRLKRSYLILGANRIGYKSSGRNAFYIKDHLGSTRSVVDLSNTDDLPSAGDNYADSSVFLVARSDNGPYGNAQVRYQNEEDEPHQFTGQETHETGLYNYGARYYDALAGRFASVDPAREFNNSYSYVGNNPVMLVDPTGEQTWIVPGTWMASDNVDSEWQAAVLSTFDDVSSDWQADKLKYSYKSREQMAFDLASDIISFHISQRDLETKGPINVVGHSHGGNVVLMASNYITVYNALTGDNVKIDNAVILNTPINLKKYRPSEEVFDNLSLVSVERDTIQNRGFGISKSDNFIDLPWVNNVLIGEDDIRGYYDNPFPKRTLSKRRMNIMHMTLWWHSSAWKKFVEPSVQTTTETKHE